jgi:hypothetical protein
MRTSIVKIVDKNLLSNSYIMGFAMRDFNRCQTLFEINSGWIAILIVVCLYLSGCTTPPQQTSSQTTKDLSAECNSIFTNTRYDNSYGYQYYVGMRRYFSIGYTNNGQSMACSFAAGGWAALSESEAKNQAIANCNRYMPTKSGCVLYADGNEIIFDKARALWVGGEQDRFYARQKDREQQAKVQINRETEQQKNEEKRIDKTNLGLSSKKETVNSTTIEVRSTLSLEASKKKCTELGFKPATEGHGKCVLQLSK